MLDDSLDVLPSITAEQLHAYRVTRYLVFQVQAEMRIGKACLEVDRLLAEERLTTAAFLTAFNPFSICVPIEQNLERNRALLAALLEAGKGLVFVGEGRGFEDTWAPEISYLALGLSRADADQLADQFHQNAYVFYSAGRASLELRRPLQS